MGAGSSPDTSQKMTLTPQPPSSSRPLKKRKVSLGNLSSPLARDLTNCRSILNEKGGVDDLVNMRKCVPFHQYVLLFIHTCYV